MTQVSAQAFDTVKTYVAGLLAGWSGKSISEGISFLFKKTKDLVKFVKDKFPTGADKKTTVLLMAGQIYDVVIYPMLPLWLKPFNSGIKKFIIDICISNLIEIFYEELSPKKDDALQTPTA